MKIKHLLCSLSILSSLCYVSSCSVNGGTQIKTVDDIKFESKTFAYDGKTHSIYVNGVPKGWCSYDMLDDIIEEYIAQTKFIYGVE